MNDSTIGKKKSDIAIWNDHGISDYKNGNFVDALFAYEKALSINSKDALIWFNKGLTLYNLQRYNEALQAYERAIQIHPKFVKAWSNKGTTFFQMQKYQDAVLAFEMALSINPNFADAWIGKGNCLREDGKLIESLSTYEKALSINSKDALIWFNKGLTLYNLQRYNEALQAYERAIQIHPKFVKAWSNKGTTFFQMQKYQDAVLAFEMALSINPNFADARKGKEKCLKQNIQFAPKPISPKQLPQELSDRYTESEFIGKGGFARVFKAKRKDGKFVAVKIPISLDASTGKSFIAEMQNWTKLEHPNIVRLYDFNIMPMPYFEEELGDSALADQNKPIESEEAAWILFNICEGLKFAHDRKIIHRDLKPQNILLKDGVPKISDWGLSRIISESTTTSATSFTPYYAAPEQINNRVKDERTDIWQLGVILYELVTGTLPFKGDSMIEIGMNIATKDPKPPGEITPDAKVIDSVVMKCLEKDPAKRYPSVLELQKDLAMYLRENYAELLKTSVSVQDYNRSAYYCGDLVMINLLTGDIPTAYKYLLDLVHYSKGAIKVEAQELSEQIKMRMELGVTEIPDELIQKAEIIVHQVSVGFRKRG